ncbi:MAG: hypothetical protein Q9183_005131 [Haloplaca sp. 2 TL-2023]
MLSFHEILVQIAEKVDDPKLLLNAQEREGLERIVVRCGAALTDVNTVLDKYSVKTGRSRTWAMTWFAAADLTPLRLRIAAQVDRLNAYNDTLILSSQTRTERNLGKIIRALRRQGSTISAESDMTCLQPERGWSDLSRVLEAEGISPQMIFDRLDEVKRLLSPAPMQCDQEPEGEQESDGSKYVQSFAIEVPASRPSVTSESLDLAKPVPTGFARLEMISEGGEAEDDPLRKAGKLEHHLPDSLSPLFIQFTPYEVTSATKRQWGSYAASLCGRLMSPKSAGLPSTADPEHLQVCMEVRDSFEDMERELWTVLRSCHQYGGFDQDLVRSLDQTLGHLVTLGIYHDMMGILGQYHIGWQLALHERVDDIVLAHGRRAKGAWLNSGLTGQANSHLELKVHGLQIVVLSAIRAIVGKDRIAVVDSLLRACRGIPFDYIGGWSIKAPLKVYKACAYLHLQASTARAIHETCFKGFFPDGPVKSDETGHSSLFTDGPVRWINTKQPGSPEGPSPETDSRPEPTA